MCWFYIQLIFLYFVFPDLSNTVRNSKSCEFAKTRGLDPGEVFERGKLPTMAVLRTEWWRMLDKIFNTAYYRQTNCWWRCHMHQSVLQTNPYGEWRGEDIFLVCSKNVRSTLVPFFNTLFLSVLTTIVKNVIS